MKYNFQLEKKNGQTSALEYAALHATKFNNRLENTLQKYNMNFQGSNH